MEQGHDSIKTDTNNGISIPGIDTSLGIKQCGNLEMYMEFLRDVYGIIDKRCDETEKSLSAGDIKNFTTCVHTLKTTCRMVGATALSESFLELEQIGKEGALEKAVSLTPDVLARFRELKASLEPFVEADADEKVSFAAEAVVELLTEIEAAAADFDISRAEVAAKKLLTYECGKELSDRLVKLSELVDNLDYDEASALAAEIKKML
ncbi:MAG: Hpt domain-containing protein [Lachnospiraceae bacterium]|nr:Hpt domain-containing protein [Lachnospiraceae bacterium]